MSCISVHIATKDIGFATIGFPSVGGIECNPKPIGGIDTHVKPLGTFDVDCNTHNANITIGLVCGTDLSAYTALCSSDGVLITIDGHYLIVKDETSYIKVMSPPEPCWITMEDPLYFRIASNTNWVIR